MPDSQSFDQPSTQAELALFVAHNAANARRSLLLVGGGTARSHAGPADISEVRLEGLNRVIDFPARDMTITVEAGIRIAELNRILAMENQRLPIDIPQAEQATLGGVIATNWSGSRRFGCGTMRDYVIGISAIDATGRRFSAGGRVVKNVAGYDLCKLLVGSRGTLAIISQVTLKLRPMTETSALVTLTFDSLSQVDTVLNRLLTSATRPMVLDVISRMGTLARPSEGAGNPPTADHPPVLIVGFEGAIREVSWQAATLLAECRPFEPRATESFVGDAAEALGKKLRDFSIDSKSSVTFKASLPPSRTCEFLRLATESGIDCQTHAGNGIVIGHLSARVSTADQALAAIKPLGDLVRSCGGHLTVLRAPNEWPRLDVVADSWAASLAWTQRLKRQLDPHSLLNPGVMAFGPA